jgi:magnesium transporter
VSTVIGLAMVTNMVVGGLAGATIPLVLRRLGRDPAQSSSIFLTTVTDSVGFATFLGLATLLLPLLRD